MAKRIFMSNLAVGIPKSNTDNELRQAAILLLDNGRADDIIACVSELQIYGNPPGMDWLDPNVLILELTLTIPTK